MTQLRPRLGTAAETSASTCRPIAPGRFVIARACHQSPCLSGNGLGRGSGRDDRHKTRSLLRKYAALLVALVGGSLIINAAIEMYYSYGESREALIAVQREKAQGAAAVIEQFVKEIEGQVGWATGFLPAGSGLDQRRFDFLRLLRQAPAITEVSYLDSDGREQIKVSRLAMDTIGEWRGLEPGAEIRRGTSQEALLQSGLLPQRIGALPHPRDCGRGQDLRRHGGGGQS